MAATPEASEHTSIQMRIKEAIKARQPTLLPPFVSISRNNMPKGLPSVLTNYIQLVELTGRCIRDDNAGYIENNLPIPLQGLNICPENWLI